MSSNRRNSTFVTSRQVRVACRGLVDGEALAAMQLVIASVAEQAIIATPAAVGTECVADY